ncbi:MAG: hypothetical protein JW723_07290 [Bacteroidales bacterium]|nr:hypothetical protein [Bacteroidales bacterium]
MYRLSILNRNKSDLYTNLIILFLIILHHLTFCSCFAQTTFSIPPPKLKFSNDSLIIRYDILEANNKDRFNIYLEISDAGGARINAHSLTGDIGDSINPGANRQIIWNLSADSIFINNTINIEIIAEKLAVSEVLMKEKELTEMSPDLAKTEDIPGNEAMDKGAEEPDAKLSRVNVGNYLLQSTIFPGWGLTRLSNGKPYWLFGVAGIGCITASVCFNRKAHLSYEQYLKSPDDDIAGYYDDAVSQGNLSKIFAWSAVVIWIADLGISGLKASNMNKSYRIGKSDAFSISPSMDIKTDTPTLSLYYNF